MTSPAIAIDGVSHRFSNVHVLEDVSLTVAPGEVLAIVGPSGCGKSTLLSIVGGLLNPTAGTVRVSSDVGESLNALTFVFQDFALLPWKSVAANVAFPLEHRGLSRHARDQIVGDALRRTGLSDFASFFPKQLSGGMRQRVALARALAVKPAFLLMDEPLSALDSQTREILMADLTALLDGTKISVIYVTHNLDEAVRLADRVAIFSRRPGRVRSVFEVPIPRSQRTTDAAIAELARAQRSLWSSIREEAAEADREITHV
ncbi:ABC transporter ATP-binding protein [Bradyrhizobium sp. NBAIM20]|nr:ABC transporter ATP-binding protein [Bradyrhizobium sp. NBAIM20]MCA1461785.1 ABC transporter ATP-binding protein [Bradyrhizobium sp. NBAIM18]